MKIAPTVSVQLDSMRGLSAIVVLVAHIHQILIAPLLPSQVDVMGFLAQSAVMVFFALSGFLICNSIVESDFNPARYFRARFNRIYPPLALSLALVLWLWLLAPLAFPTGTTAFAWHSPDVARHGLDLDAASLLGSALFLNGFFTPLLPANGPLWSLPMEVWYYAVAGLLAMRLPWKVLGALVFALLTWRNRTFGVLALVWFAGGFIALGWRPSRLLLPAIAVAALALNWHMAGLLLEKLEAFYRTIVGLSFAALLYAVVNERVRLPAPFSNSASYSYTLYITHFPILLFVYGVLQPRIWGSLTGTLLTSATCFIGCLALARALSVVERWKPLHHGRGPFVLTA